MDKVPLKGGGICGLVLSGDYYEEGKDTYLCVPLNTVDGGLAPLPAGPIGENDAANHPLFIKLDKGQTLEIVGGVYQVRNADGSAAWYVNPVDNDKGKAGAKIDGKYIKQPEIVWSLKDPEAFPSQSFEYLTSTDFAQQVLDWEAEGKFPQVPDTAVPTTSINLFDPNDRCLVSPICGMTTIYRYTDRDMDTNLYYTHPERKPYVLAGVWNIEYQGEKAFFVLKKSKNPDGSIGFEGLIYKPKSSNPKAISWELIDLGFGSSKGISTGLYFASGSTGPENGCGLYFKIYGGKSDSAFCTWYFDHPDLVYNREFFNNWARTGNIINYITGKDGKEVSFIPISPAGAFGLVK